MKRVQGTLDPQLSRFLFCYRTTLHATTGQPPAELMFGRPLRTRLDMLKSDTGRRVRGQQEQQKRAHDASAKSRELVPGTNVSQKLWPRAPVDSRCDP